MPLEIIGAGFGRTSTMSTYTALKQLGFPCYHMMEVLENPVNKSHLAFWRQVANAPEGTQHDWEQVFASYRATMDNPGCCVWRELAAAYPEAKVLLTLHPRGADAWYQSTMDTIYFTETMWQFKVLAFATPFGRKFAEMSRKLIWQRSHRGTMADREKAIARYHQHIDEVRSAIPSERLLIFSADMGWEPLCRFLEVPVPDMPFPNVNDKESFQQTKRKMTRGAYGILALAALLLAAVGYVLS
ncbi:MAG: sulfotransferase family protein [Porticoccaceae bacterium]